MSDTYKLQLRHGAESKNFSTRDEVLGYINGQLQYGGVSLLPYEPILFFYGEDDAKNAIIMVGLPEGKTQEGKSYFIVDTADLKKQIEEIDTKYEEAIEALKEEDVKLLEAINKEIEDRTAADEAETEARTQKDAELEDAITQETESRVKKDEELQEAIDFTKADLMSVIDACGLIYNEKLAEGRVSYTPDMHDEVIRDAKDITEAIDKISKFAVQLGKDLKISVANTDTVDLTLTPNDKDGGTTLTAEVNIAGTEGLSKKNYDNNIIGKTVEGLYASASIEPSATNPNILIFKTSGYIDGQFKVDAFETEVPLTAYKGDNGKTTGVTVSVDTDKNIISAELNIASDKNNILKLEDGEYIVHGLAKNIKYKDTNVANALNSQSERIDEIEDSIEFVKAFEVKGSETDSANVSVDKTAKGDFNISTDVKLSTDKSIIISNGGLKANVSATFKKGTSTLLIEVGNNEYAIDLSDLAVSVLKSATYDAGNEELVLEFIVGDTTKTVRVPVGTLIHDVEVDDSDTIDMTLRTVKGGPNHISAELRVDKSHADNILTVNSNGAYVSKAFITDAVKVETDERKAADEELKSKIEKVTELANTNKEAIATEATTARAAEKANADAIAQEIKDARAAEGVNAKAIEKNADAIKENKTAIGDEVARATKAEQINATAITAEETRAKEAEVKNANAIASEIDRAMEKEADLLEKIGGNTEKIKENTTAIATETERATKADAEIKAAVEATAASVETEVNRAKAAEEKLTEKVAKNTEDVTAAKELATNVDKALETEITRAKAAEEANATAVTTESNRAKAAEEKLTEKVAKNTEDVTAAKELVTNVDKALETEITRAKAAEETLAEKVAKNTEDVATAKQGVVDADKAIQTEVTRAKAAEEANATAIETESNRATHAETDLLEKINKNVADIQTVETEIGNIELKKEGDLSYALYVNGTKHGEFTIPQDQFLKSVTYDPTTKELVFVFKTTSGDVTTRVSIADLVDTYEAGNGLILNGKTFSVDFTNVASVESVENGLNAESIRAKAAEEANATAITTETNRATHVEEDLAEKITKNTQSIETLSTEVGEIELRKEDDLSYALYVNGTKHGELSIPKDQFLKSVTYDPTNKDLIFVFNTSTGEATTKVSVADLVDTYEAGNGLVLNGNTFSIDSTVALKADVNNSIANEVERAKAAESTLSTKLNEVDSVVKINSNNISSLSENLTNEITRSKIADENIEALIETEKERAMTAEGVLADSIKENKTSILKLEENLQIEKNRALEAESSIQTKVENEVIRANGAEKHLSSLIENEINRAQTAETAIKNNSEAEIVRALNAEKELKDLIDTKANSVDVYTKAEILEKLADYTNTTELNEKLSEKVNITELEGNYATKQSVQELADISAKKADVKASDEALSERIKSNEDALDEIDITYNSATSELTYVDTKGVSHVYKLYSGSLIKSGSFDTKSNSIVLTIETAGRESTITIPVTELLSEVDERITTNTTNIQKINEAIAKLSKSWKTKDSSTISFDKTTVGEEDVLTGEVRVASSNKQAIQSTGDGLYVSNDLEDYTCVFGSEGTISGQDAISKLLESSNSIKNDVNNLTEKVTKNTSDIEKLDQRVSTNERDIANLKLQVNTNTNDITNLKSRVEKNEKDIVLLDGRVSVLEGKVNTLETKVNTLESKVDVLTNDVTTIKATLKEHETRFNTIENNIEDLRELIENIIGGGGATIPELLAEINKIKKVTAYDTYNNAKNMSVRLDEIEQSVGGDVMNEINNIKNVMIGPKDGSVDGSIWHELNNVVDAGTF